MNVYSNIAGNIAAENNLYTMNEFKNDPQILERIWSEYEGQLEEAINLLLSGQVDAKTWVRVLIPFISNLLVRGPDFNQRFTGRIHALGIDPLANNINAARMMELQRLLGEITTAEGTGKN